MSGLANYLGVMGNWLLTWVFYFIRKCRPFLQLPWFNTDLNVYVNNYVGALAVTCAAYKKGCLRE